MVRSLPLASGAGPEPCGRRLGSCDNRRAPTDHRQSAHLTKKCHVLLREPRSRSPPGGIPNVRAPKGTHGPTLTPRPGSPGPRRPYVASLAPAAPQSPVAPQTQILRVPYDHLGEERSLRASRESRGGTRAHRGARRLGESGRDDSHCSHVALPARRCAREDGERRGNARRDETVAAGVPAASLRGRKNAVSSRRAVGLDDDAACAPARLCQGRRSGARRLMPGTGGGGKAGWREQSRGVPGYSSGPTDLPLTRSLPLVQDRPPESGCISTHHEDRRRDPRRRRSCARCVRCGCGRCARRRPIVATGRSRDGPWTQPSARSFHVIRRVVRQRTRAS